MEGTNIRSEPGAAERITEQDVEEALLSTLLSTPGLVAILSSAQNLDRLVTVFRATLRSGRTLVADLYTASVAGQPADPPSRSPASTVRGVRAATTTPPDRPNEEFQRVSEIARQISSRFPEHLATQRGSTRLLRRVVDCTELRRSQALCTTVRWSGPSGRATSTSQTARRLRELLQKAEVPLLHHHTSGHARVEDLARLVEAFAPAASCRSTRKRRPVPRALSASRALRRRRVVGSLT